MVLSKNVNFNDVKAIFRNQKNKNNAVTALKIGTYQLPLKQI